MSKLGGFISKDVIKNIMQQVLTDDLAMQFNWQGRGDKKAFSKLILTDVIRGKHTAAWTQRRRNKIYLKNKFDLKNIQTLYSCDYEALYNKYLRISNSVVMRFLLSDAALARNVNMGHCETEIKKYLSYAACRMKLREKGGEWYRCFYVNAIMGLYLGYSWAPDMYKDFLDFDFKLTSKFIHIL